MIFYTLNLIMIIIVPFLTNPGDFDQDLANAVSAHPTFRVTSAGGTIDSWMRVSGSAVLTDEPDEPEIPHQW